MTRPRATIPVPSNCLSIAPDPGWPPPAAACCAVADMACWTCWPVAPSTGAAPAAGSSVRSARCGNPTTWGWSSCWWCTARPGPPARLRRSLLPGWPSALRGPDRPPAVSARHRQSACRLAREGTPSAPFLLVLPPVCGNPRLASKRQGHERAPVARGGGCRAAQISGVPLCRRRWSPTGSTAQHSAGSPVSQNGDPAHHGCSWPTGFPRRSTPTTRPSLMAKGSRPGRSLAPQAVSCDTSESALAPRRRPWSDARPRAYRSVEVRPEGQLVHPRPSSRTLRNLNNPAA